MRENHKKELFVNWWRRSVADHKAMRARVILLVGDGCKVLFFYRLDGEAQHRYFAQETGEGADLSHQYALEADFWESRDQFF